ncbi:hypothetical protein HYFRA_00008475 [Hymenoscyphus fraxineus]|uniref:Uncharacterized protein n=1 Tax=Hymenoscyphus fraxineus TaxID=746836 RepID=A0A9N9KQL0_9HELO|nr:hypothetical protein HYFRA_00008475 [Hymenoscyphus fraxineus]
MAPFSLVTPASRGIGFHLTRHLLRTTSLPVVATARKNMEHVRKGLLKDMNDIDPERLTVLELDVTDESTIAHASSTLQSTFPPSKNHLHLAFSLPGILYPEKSPSQLSHKELTHTFAINTIGPLLLSKHFLPFLPKRSTSLPPPPPGSWVPQHATWVNMSARVGSTTDNKLGGWYSYRASKAGVNSLTKGFDIFVQQRCGEKAMVMAYHPGTVRTRLSKEFWGSVGRGKLFEPEWAVERMCSVVGEVGLKGRGRCWDWEGKEVLP